MTIFLFEETLRNLNSTINASVSVQTQGNVHSTKVIFMIKILHIAMHLLIRSEMKDTID